MSVTKIVAPPIATSTGYEAAPSGSMIVDDGTNCFLFFEYFADLYNKVYLLIRAADKKGGVS